ncbi:MAG TPA: hypothetical protein VL284_17580 [Thermoanaerobaculia bacterium]|nr:hypothetical protein [Thermoanaerobaculia bacterium]
MPYKSPSDFAAYLRTYLLNRRDRIDIDERILSEISQTLFAASLLSEEGRAIRCHFSYLDPNNPDPRPPRRIVRNRWQPIAFGTQIRLTTGGIVKLALATDPRTSSMAIYADRVGRPFIWGLVDQANESHALSVFESESGMARPGLFHLSILGAGHISASAGFVRVAELRGGILVRESLPVFERGPVRSLLQPYIDASTARVTAAVREDIYGALEHTGTNR